MLFQSFSCLPFISGSFQSAPLENHTLPSPITVLKIFTGSPLVGAKQEWLLERACRHCRLWRFRCPPSKHWAMSSLRSCGRGWYMPSALRAVCALQHIEHIEWLKKDPFKWRRYAYMKTLMAFFGAKTLKILWAANIVCESKRFTKDNSIHDNSTSKSLFQQRWTSTPLGWDDDALSEKFLECNNYVCVASLVLCWSILRAGVQSYKHAQGNTAGQGKRD